MFCQFECGNLNTSNITALNALCNVTVNKVWKNNVTVNNKTKATRGGGDSFFIYSLWWIFSNVWTKCLLKILTPNIRGCALNIEKNLLIILNNLHIWILKMGLLVQKLCKTGRNTSFRVSLCTHPVFNIDNPAKKIKF